jgi:hypothetical protein
MTSGANSAVAARAGVVLDLAAVEVFERTFREGMDLVQEASTYLDGAGRMEARRLGREAASDYASESMRLTTRLMQVSSWLLVQKAVRDGETPAAAAWANPDPEDPGQAGCRTHLLACRSAPTACLSGSPEWTANCILRSRCP